MLIVMIPLGHTFAHVMDVQNRDLIGSLLFVLGHYIVYNIWIVNSEIVAGMGTL